jgi:hypothetical protein
MPLRPAPVLPGPGGPVRRVLAGHQAGICPCMDEVPETDVWLRLTPARNNNQYGIRLAEDHTLAAWAARQQVEAEHPHKIAA